VVKSTSVPTPIAEARDPDGGTTTSFTSIEALPKSGNLPLSVSFRAADLAHAMFGPVTGYRWDFGDGDLGEGIATEHTYTRAGSYTAILTISYENGTRSVAERTVQVGIAVITPTAVPGVVSTSSPNEPTSAPAQTPPFTPTSAPTVTPSTPAIPVPAASLPVDLEGLEISSQGKVIKVSLFGLPETVADQAQSLPGVTKVERYLKVAASDYPGPIIGMEPGSALRVGDIIVTLATGEGFQSRDERVSIPGVSLNSTPFIGGDGMAGMMVHRFMPGQSFLVKGVRLRVVGLFRAPDKSQEQAMLLPLGTAQELFGLQGQLTNIFVTVDAKENVEVVTGKIKEILGAK
jgi:hypothetical protein